MACPSSGATGSTGGSGRAGELRGYEVGIKLQWWQGAGCYRHGRLTDSCFWQHSCLEVGSCQNP